LSQHTAGPTVLIVDDDLGFVWWLGELFHEAGYRPVPALSARQAISLVKEVNLKVAVAVVNPELRGARKLIKTLRQAESRLVKIVLIRDPTALTTVVVGAHAILERPSDWEPPSRHEWLRKLRRILKEAEETAAILNIGEHPPHKHH
jgi:ActR/RegA family two-component response regulator